MSTPGGEFRAVAWRPPRDEAELRRALNSALDEAAVAAMAPDLGAVAEAWTGPAAHEWMPAADRASAAGIGSAAAPAAQAAPAAPAAPVAPASSAAPALVAARPAQRHVRSMLLAKMGLAALGLVLVGSGILLVTDPLTGRNLIDEARLTSLWPLVLALAGVVVVAEAIALDSRAGRAMEPAPARLVGAGVGAGEPTTASRADTEVGAPSLQRPPERLSRAEPGSPSVGMRPTGQPTPGPFAPLFGPFVPAAGTLPPAPGSVTPAAGSVAPAPSPVAPSPEAVPPVPGPAAQAPGPPSPAPGHRPSDLVADLLVLKAMRRHGLISKRQYRMRRRALVAQMAPRSVEVPWPESVSGDVRAADATHPLA